MIEYRTQPLNDRHRQLQLRLKEVYELRGYVVEAEYPLKVNGHNWRVDLLIKKDGVNCIIEIWSVANLEKLNYLLTNTEYVFSLIPGFKVCDKGYYYCVCGHRWYPKLNKPKFCPACKKSLTYVDKTFLSEGTVSEVKDSDSQRS